MGLLSRTVEHLRILLDQYGLIFARTATKNLLAMDRLDLRGRLQRRQLTPKLISTF